MKKNTLIPAAICLVYGLFAVSPGVAATLPEFSELVETYGPSVVNIGTKHKKSRRSTRKFHGFSIPDLPVGLFFGKRKCR